MKKIFYLFILFIINITFCNAQVWKLYTTTEGLANNSVNSLTIDQTGNLCITTNGGFSIFNGSTFTNYTTSNGLPSNWVKAITCDDSGNIWLGTSSGLSKYNGSTFTNYNTTNGLPSNNITALSAATGGILWIGTASSGISKYNGSNFTNYTTTNGLISNSIKCLCTDLSNNLWIGTSYGISKFDGTTFTNYTTTNGLPSNNIITLHCDASGNIWIGTTTGLTNYNGTNFVTMTTVDGLLSNNITAIDNDNLGNIWIGYNVYGISKYDGTSFTHFTQNNGFNWYNLRTIKCLNNNIYVGTNGLLEFKKWTIPPYRFDYLDTNNIAAGINACGVLFEKPSGECSFIVPKNTGVSTIACSAIWMGGFDQNNLLHITAQKYINYQNDTWTGPLFANLNTFADDSIWNRIWKISKSDIDFHVLNYNQPSYVVPKSILEWPAPTADYVDVNFNNLYDPENGDYPLIRGDQAILSIYNDIAYPHFSGGLPLGVEVHSLSFSFNSPDSAIANTVFNNYKIYNKSTNNYSDFYLGVSTDIDVGIRTDDYIGCDSTLSLYYGYNGTNSDGQYGSHIPAQGVVFLSSLMNSFNYFSINLEPVTSNEVYNVLNGYWNDGTPYTYGGNGYGGTVYTNYCFSSYPNVPGWSEVTENNAPADRRGVGTVGPFTFNAGTTLCVDVAFINAISYSGNNLTSVNPLLRKRTADLIAFYHSQNWDCGQIFADTNTIAHIYTHDTTICKGAPYYFNNIIVGGTPPYTYSWSPSSGLSNNTVLNPIAIPNGTTQYILTATDHLNHVISDTILINVFTPYVDAGIDTTVCSNETVTLTASSGFIGYDWSCCGYTQSINVNTNHTYSGTVDFSVTAYYQSYSCSNSDTVSVTFLPSPDVDFGNDIILCNTETLILDAGAGAEHYIWNTGATTNSVLIDGTSLPLGIYTYNVHAWNNNGCNSYDTISVNVQVCSEINELAGDGFKIYPNPSEGTFYIESGQSYFARITNITGDTVFEKIISQGTEKINLKNISKGIYLLEIITNQKILKTKLVLK